MVFSCAVVNSYEPMRLAGTWKQYSAKAMSQLMTMTLNRGAWRYFRWPYQAKVMKMLERVRNSIVVMGTCCLILGFGCTYELRVSANASRMACSTPSICFGVPTVIRTHPSQPGLADDSRTTA